jgi:hypothetical protein
MCFDIIVIILFSNVSTVRPPVVDDEADQLSGRSLAMSDRLVSALKLCVPGVRFLVFGPRRLDTGDASRTRKKSRMPFAANHHTTSQVQGPFWQNAREQPPPSNASTVVSIATAASTTRLRVFGARWDSIPGGRTAAHFFWPPLTHSSAQRTTAPTTDNGIILPPRSANRDRLPWTLHFVRICRPADLSVPNASTDSGRGG